MAKIEHGWRHPALVGLLGLGLMIAGWKIRTWEPALSPQQAAEDRQVSALVAQAEQEGAADQQQLAEKLGAYSHSRSSAAHYQVLGRVLFLFGLFLFIAAGVLFYRQPSTQEERPTEDPAGPGEGEPSAEEGPVQE